MRITTIIKETIMKTVEVEADNNIEAVSKVAKMYADCDIILTADDHVDTTIYVRKDNEND